jgi:HPt (histidine-containing phosphotransfer) domain-containing protein
MYQEATNSRTRIVVRPPEDLPYKVAAQYLDGCRMGLESLKDAIARADFDFVGVYAHRMKGSGGAYGFAELTGIGARMERAAQFGNYGAVRECAAALEAYLEAVEVAAP